MLAPEAIATSVLPCAPVFLGPGLGAGHRQRAGRFEDGAGIFEDVLDRGADGVGIDQHHLIHVLLAQAESLLADVLHRRAVGEQADRFQPHAAARLERTVHGIGIGRLDADHFRFRPQALDVGRDTGDQAAAADAAEHRVDRLRMLAQDFHADGALPGDHIRIVEGMDEVELLLLLQFQCVGVGRVVGIAEQDHFGAALLHGIDLDGRRGGRHHDHGADARASAPTAPRPGHGCRPRRRSRRASSAPASGGRSCCRRRAA
jgi:hypothetical protein